MEIDREQESRIKALMAKTDCSKDFKCYKSGFKDLCKVEHLSSANMFLCLDKEGWVCEFALFSGDRCFCRCQVRKEIASELGL